MESGKRKTKLLNFRQPNNETDLNLPYDRIEREFKKREVISMKVKKVMTSFVLALLAVASLGMLLPTQTVEARWWTYGNNGNYLQQTSLYGSDYDYNNLWNRVSSNDRIYNNRYSYLGNRNNMLYYRNANNNGNYRWLRSYGNRGRFYADRNFYSRMNNFNNRYTFINQYPSQFNARNIYFYDSSDPNNAIYLQNLIDGDDTLDQAYVMMSSADFMNLLRAVDSDYYNGSYLNNLTLNAGNRTVQFYSPYGNYNASCQAMSFY
jgi:hypothetical protein